MGDIDIEIEVDGIEETIGAFKLGLEKGLDAGGDWMLREGKDKAQGIVLSTDRVWRSTLKQGFSSNETGPDIAGISETGRYYSWEGEIRNDAPHATIVEHGLKPGNSPPVQAILPWIDDKLIPDQETQEKADRANIGYWDPMLQAAAVQYGKAQVLTAFAVKSKLENRGYKGIRFMETTESYLNQVGHIVVRNKIVKHMNAALRTAGTA